jgi:hypothetical protein
MAPAAVCALDSTELGAQLMRYRSAGEGGRLLRDNPQELVIAVSDAVDDRIVDELVAVERSCCPFFEIAWAPDQRTLSIGVSDPQDAPALDAIRHALLAS